MLAVTVYTGYLVYAGLTLVLFPWHEAWTVTVVRLPPRIAAILDEPWVRGMVSGFGALHLMVLAAELALPAGLRGHVTAGRDDSASGSTGGG